MPSRSTPVVTSDILKKLLQFILLDQAPTGVLFALQGAAFRTPPVPTGKSGPLQIARFFEPAMSTLFHPLLLPLTVHEPCAGRKSLLHGSGVKGLSEPSESHRNTIPVQIITLSFLLLRSNCSLHTAHTPRRPSPRPRGISLCILPDQCQVARCAAAIGVPGGVVAAALTRPA